MANKSLLFLISILLLLSLLSCSNEPKSLFIVSEGGSEIYFHSGSHNSEVIIQKEVQDFLLERSGMSLSEFYGFLAQGTDNETVYVISNDFMLRNNYTTLLVTQYETESLMRAYSEHKREIQNSEIFKRIDSASTGFDSKLMKLAHGKEFDIYSLSYIFNGEESWSEISVFLPEWIKRISR